MRTPTEPIGNALGEETDRGCVLVGVAYIDFLLEQLLRWKFQANTTNNESNQRRIDTILVDGPTPLLGSIWARSIIAFLIGAIDEEFEVAWSFTAERVVEVLQYLFAVRGTPEHLCSDNGPEFVAQAVTRWLERAGVATLLIAKGSPWENGYVESFNSRLRDELLDRELFLSLADARWVVDRWRLDYNHHRPHSSLDYQTPAAFAARCAASAAELLSATPQATPPLQQQSGPLTPDTLIQAGT